MLAALAVYNLNFQRIASGDTQGASLVPLALWLDGSVRLDRFSAHASEPRVPFWKDGHAYSTYPIALPF